MIGLCWHGGESVWRLRLRAGALFKCMEGMKYGVYMCVKLHECSVLDLRLHLPSSEKNWLPLWSDMASTGPSHPSSPSPLPPPSAHKVWVNPFINSRTTLM